MPTWGFFGFAPSHPAGLVLLAIALSLLLAAAILLTRTLRLRRSLSRAVAGLMTAVQPSPERESGAESGSVEARIQRLSADIARVIDSQRADEARAGAERFLAIFEGAPLGITVSRDGLILLANGRFARMLGYPDANSLQGMSLLDLVPPEDRENLRTRIVKREDGDQTSDSYLIQGLRQDGSRLILEIHAARLLLGARSSSIEFVTDVTHRVRAEEVLRESEERFRQLADGVSEVFWITDEAYRSAVYVNGAYEAVLGRKREEFLADPRSRFRAVHPEDRGRLSQALAERAVSGFEEEYRVLREDGTCRFVQERVFPIRNARGAIIRLGGVARDVTQLRRAEESLRQSQKMDALGKLAGAVAHDFNNLLTAILGYADLLLGRSGADASARAEIEEIRAAGQRAASLTRQLLAFSRKQPLQPKVLNLNAVVLGVERLLRRLVREDIALTFDLASQPLRVRADHGQLEQVIINLVVNARDAMPGGGTVRIETAGLEADGASFATLSIGDTGCGMSADVRAHLFEPFFSTKGPGQGTGLGLATVYGIVSQSDGRIDVESEEGRGTVFHIRLPLAGGAEDPPTTEIRTEGQSFAGRSVLVVEDDEGVRKLARALLEDVGFRVLEAADGFEALKLLENASVDLVLSDNIMPRMHGSDLLRRLRERGQGQTFILMSGYADTATLSSEAALRAVLSKPFTRESLLQAVIQKLSKTAGVRAENTAL